MICFFHFINFLFTECQDLITQCLRIEASQRILLEDVLRHPWMRGQHQESSHSSCSIQGPPRIEYSVLATSCPVNSETKVLVPLASENQHKPSLNSVGSCVSSSTDECAESPQHLRPLQLRSSRLCSSQRARPPNSAPQTSSCTTTTSKSFVEWINKQPPASSPHQQPVEAAAVI